MNLLQQPMLFLAATKACGAAARGDTIYKERRDAFMSPSGSSSTSCFSPLQVETDGDESPHKRQKVDSGKWMHPRWQEKQEDNLGGKFFRSVEEMLGKHMKSSGSDSATRKRSAAGRKISSLAVASCDQERAAISSCKL